jgi:preprotein translocase subunit SecB
VSLKVEVRAQADEGTTFQIELLYAGLFGIRNVSEEQLHPFLYAEAPRLLFPFARRVIADVVRDGGFPPLVLDPIDFGAMYLAQQQGGDDNSGIIGHA